MKFLKKIRKWHETAYFRGRYPYCGDRIDPKMGYYWFEGYAGANLGDEIIHHVIAEMLRPNIDVFLGRFSTPRDCLNRMIRKENPRGIVFGGGTLRPNFCLDRLSRLKSESSIPLYTFGSGLVGYRNNLSATDPTIQPLWEKLFSLTDDGYIGVRGPRSQKIMTILGKESVVTGDTAIAVFDKIERTAPSQILANFGNHDTVMNQETINFYLAVLNMLLKYKLPILLVPLHHLDIVCHDLILKNAPSSVVESVERLQSIPSTEQFRALMSRTLFGVGERLHFGIPLTASGIPTAMLGYLDKHLDFAESIDAPGIVFPIAQASVEEIESFLDSASRRSFLQEEYISENLRGMRSLQFEALSEIAESLRS